MLIIVWHCESETLDPTLMGRGFGQKFCLDITKVKERDNKVEGKMFKISWRHSWLTRSVQKLNRLLFSALIFFPCKL